MSGDLPDFLKELLAEADKEAKERKPGRPRKKTGTVEVKPKKTPREQRFARYTSSRWRDEALILVINCAHCTHCERTHESPNLYPLIRRYHPVYGIHEECLGSRPSSDTLATLPQRIEYHCVDVPVCQYCFGLGGEIPVNQLEFDFSADILPFPGAQNDKTI